MSPSDIGTILYRLGQQDEQLKEIKQHVQKTNGRVSRLELWQARLEGAKWAVSWMPALATGVVGGVMVAVVGHFL